MFDVTCLDADNNPITRLTQWDINQSLIIKNTGLQQSPMFHFYNQNCKEAYVVPSVLENDIITVNIPNILLQEGIPIVVCMYVYSSLTSAKTVATIKIPVRPRPKPSEYKYVENIDVVSVEQFKKEISEDLENLKTLQVEITADMEQIRNDFSTMSQEFETYKPLLDGKISTEEKGAVNGVAELDGTGKVPESQLPSYVDDIIEGTYDTFPSTGETGKIYVDTETNKTWRWSGTQYTEISASISLGETSSTAYPGNKGAKNASDIALLKESAVGKKTEQNGEIFNDYRNNIASGEKSHAEGQGTEASGNYSHTEGFFTYAEGDYSHAEGFNSRSRGHCAHVEGQDSSATGDGSHAEGEGGLAIGRCAHFEGINHMSSEPGIILSRSGTNKFRVDIANTSYITIKEDIWLANFENCPIIGYATNNSYNIMEANITDTVWTFTTSTDINTEDTAGVLYIYGAVGDFSHSEGGSTVSIGQYAHSEGHENMALNNNAHAEGKSTAAIGESSHAEGGYTKANGNLSHSEGFSTKAIGDFSHAEGSSTIAEGTASHTEGKFGHALGAVSHVEGNETHTGLKGYYVRAIDDTTGKIYLGNPGDLFTGDTTIISDFKAYGSGFYFISTVEDAIKDCDMFTSDSVINNVITIENPQRLDGGIAYWDISPQDIVFVYSKDNPNWGNAYFGGENSHAEGSKTYASHNNSHAEGNQTQTRGENSHAEGLETQACGENSHAEGYDTIASSDNSHVEGCRNIIDTDRRYVHIVGNGNPNGLRSNAHTIDWNGNCWYSGNVKVGGTSYDDGEVLATESFVQSCVQQALGNISTTLDNIITTQENYV